MRLLKNIFARRAKHDGRKRNGQPSAAPSSVSAHDGLQKVGHANALAADGRYVEALSAITAALKFNPDDFDLRFARATVLFGWGRYREAREAMSLLSDRGAALPAFCMKLGWASLWTGHLVEAEHWMRRGVAIDPHNWEMHFGLGTCLHATKKTEEGRGAFTRALELKPDDPYCLANLSVCEVELKQLDVAENLSRRLVRLDPTSSIAWSNLGVVLEQKDRFEEAIRSFEKAEQLCDSGGDQPYDYVNFAICLLHAGRTEDGVAFLESKLPERPFAQAHSHYALSLLLLGRFAEGWSQYEFRWLDGPLKNSRQDFSTPTWEGQNLRDRTVLLRSEQGYGDFIQFIRFAPELKKRGANVVLQLTEPMRKLSAYVDGIDRVLQPNEPYPPFDFFVNLLSLPRVLGTDIEQVGAAVPYIRTDPLASAQWGQRLGDPVTHVKVGLVWAGSPTHMRDKCRSIRLDELAPLGQIDGLKFFSLQKGAATAELRRQSPALKIVDLEPELNDFVDTAAAISQLDLVICVDTAIAHLAGALGKPVWLLLSKPNDWRWLEGRDDTPWYPSMRLFRQWEVGKWSDVVKRVADALRNFASQPSQVLEMTGSVTAAQRRTPESSYASKHPAFSAVAYTKVGMLQYWPEQEPVGPSLRYYGEYLQEHVDLLGRFIHPAATVLEVGCGVGVHAVAIGKLISAKGHLMVIESCAKMQVALRQNLSSNGVGGVTFFRDPLHGPRCVTIDQLQLESLHCLKIGTDALATEILQGAAETLWRLRPIVFAAANDDDSVGSLGDALQICSYRTWRMEVPLFSPSNFNKRSDDIFNERRAIAVLGTPEEIDMDIALEHCTELR